MCMTNIKPYTYKITNEITGHWYIGKKTANEVPAVEDITYWGSSKYLKDLMVKIPTGWKKEIIAEYDSDDETGLAEEKLIKENWELPGRVNRCKGQGKGVDFSDPNVKAKFLAACRTLGYREKRSEIAKNIRATESEEIKKKRIDAVKTPEYRAKRSEIRANESEETRKKRIDASASVRNTSEYKENHAAAQKARAKIIIATNITTGEEFEMQGTKEIKSYEFDNAHVRSCCKEKYSKTNIYKNHIFRYKE
jgi:hypothetical protein